MNENEKEKNLPEVKSVDLSGGIVPKNFEDLNRFAQLVQKSGLAPKSFDTVEKVAIGILTNMELGRPVITGLQDLAIINGRAGIYGDASLAMVTASQLMEAGYPIETETGTPFTDDWTFTFKVKRTYGPERVGSWTWIEAKRAGFDNPKQRDGRPDNFSPWRRFTRRMMQWKARNYVLRDTFGDVLRGMKTVEELHDLDGVVELAESSKGTFEAADDEMDQGPDSIVDEAALTAGANIQDSLKRFESADRAGLIEFVEETAKANDCSVIDIMNEANENVDAFKSAFKKWASTRKPTEKNSGPVVNPVENVADWNRLKPENFIKYCSMHKKEIAQASDAVFKKISSKWARFFPGLDPLELFITKIEATSAEAADEKTDVGNGDNVESLRDDSISTNSKADDEGKGMAESEIVQPGPNDGVDITQSDEWQELTAMQSMSPEIYKKVVAGRPLKTIDDLTAAIIDLDNAIAAADFDAGGHN